MNSRSKLRLDLVALLSAFTLFLSTIEYLIPKPVPFMRLGLANLPLMLALTIFTPQEYFLLAFMKFFGQAMISGTIFSYVALFSASGTLTSATLMFLLHRYAQRHLSLIGIGVSGAMASNLTQLLLSRYLLFGPSARYIAPPFLTLGLITSLLLGLFAQRFVESSLWFKKHRRS